MMMMMMMMTMSVNSSLIPHSTSRVCTEFEKTQPAPSSPFICFLFVVVVSGGGWVGGWGGGGAV